MNDTFQETQPNLFCSEAFNGSGSPEAGLIVNALQYKQLVDLTFKVSKTHLSNRISRSIETKASLSEHPIIKSHRKFNEKILYTVFFSSKVNFFFRSFFIIYKMKLRSWKIAWGQVLKIDSVKSKVHTHEENLSYGKNEVSQPNNLVFRELEYINIWIECEIKLIQWFWDVLLLCHHCGMWS